MNQEQIDAIKIKYDEYMLKNYDERFRNSFVVKKCWEIFERILRDEV